MRPTVAGSHAARQSIMGQVLETDLVDATLNEQVTTHEQAVATTQGGQGGGMDMASAYQARAGRR